MSEPVRESDIEDVLSSIRRLVSEEGRPIVKAQAPEIKEKSSDRLVLTPALRVADIKPEPTVETAPEQALVTTEQPKVEGSIEDKAEAKAPLQRDVSADQVAEAADERRDPQPEFRHQSDRHVPHQTEDQSALVADKPDDLPVDEPANDAANSEPEIDDASTEFLIEDKWQDANPVDMAIADEMTKAQTDRPEGEIRLEERIAGLEAAVGGRDDQWEPDGASDDDYSGGPVESLPWEDSDTARKPRQSEPVTDEVDEAEAYGDDEAAEPFAAAADEIDEGAASELFAEDTILDEESLRELVAEIVRQELQGSLGERITRNVRKLVRREIHRALASQDLE